MSLIELNEFRSCHVQMDATGTSIHPTEIESCDTEIENWRKIYI